MELREYGRTTHAARVAIGKRVKLYTPWHNSAGLLGTIKLPDLPYGMHQLEFLILPQEIYDLRTLLDKPKDFFSNPENLPIEMYRLKDQGLIYLGEKNGVHRVAVPESSFYMTPETKVDKVPERSLIIPYTDIRYKELKEIIDKAGLIPNPGL